MVYWIAVAEELPFGRAAIRLHISQPPWSQQIRQLEEGLGVKLFDRTKGEVRLTGAGRRIVDEAYQVLSQHVLGSPSGSFAHSRQRLGCPGDQLSGLGWDSQILIRNSAVLSCLGSDEFARDKL